MYVLPAEAIASKAACVRIEHGEFNLYQKCATLFQKRKRVNSSSSNEEEFVPDPHPRIHLPVSGTLPMAPGRTPRLELKDDPDSKV
jgi:hypothetical protein